LNEQRFVFPFFPSVVHGADFVRPKTDSINTRGTSLTTHVNNNSSGFAGGFDPLRRTEFAIPLKNEHACFAHRMFNLAARVVRSNVDRTTARTKLIAGMDKGTLPVSETRMNDQLTLSQTSILDSGRSESVRAEVC
jgi:hypothetical protein